MIGEMFWKSYKGGISFFTSKTRSWRVSQPQNGPSNPKKPFKKVAFPEWLFHLQFCSFFIYSKRLFDVVLQQFSQNNLPPQFPLIKFYDTLAELLEKINFQSQMQFTCKQMSFLTIFSRGIREIKWK